MTVRKFLYGATGFLSLIGVIGVLGNEKGFLPFFVFAVNFEYCKYKRKAEILFHTQNYQ